jgi:uncharacterized membrane protein YgdD (TMEM256/DUF423 family)
MDLKFNFMTPKRNFICAGAILGVLAIIFGAYGAHALKKTLDPSQMAAFDTGVTYQMYHALFLLFVGLLPVREHIAKSMLQFVVWGIICFSGSIYLLATRSVTGVDIRPIGWITPIGGLLLIAAWVILFVEFVRKKS